MDCPMWFAAAALDGTLVQQNGVELALFKLQADCASRDNLEALESMVLFG